MSEKPSDDDRIHSEAPAEGDRGTGAEDTRVHAEEPAEGADPDDQDGAGS